MTPDPDIMEGEILPPELCAFINRRRLEMEFDELAGIYGYSRAREIWNEIPQECGDAEEA